MFFEIDFWEMFNLGEIFESLSPAGGVGGAAVTALIIVARWFIYEKAGEPGWATFVPFYSTYVLFKIIYGNGWKFLLLLIPVANIVIWIVAQFRLARAFGKSGGFGAGLWLLPFVFYPILGFTKETTYKGPVIL